MTNVIEADLAIIGAGSGGLSVAAGAAQLGARVVLAEKGKMGGDCLNYGCVPSKALIAAAHAAHAIRSSGRLGVNGHEPGIEFAKVYKHVQGVITAIAPNDSVERFRGLGVRVIEGAARFTDALTIKAGGERIRARRIVVATGSSAAVPPIAGLRDIPYLTNETVFDLTDAPEHLIVIGGGPIGLELAQALSYLLVLRLIPVFPFFIVNLVPALLGVPLFTYMVGTFLGIIPGTFVFASIGAGLGSLFDSMAEVSLKGALTPEVITALCGLAILSLIPVAYKKLAARRGRQS